MKETQQVMVINDSYLSVYEYTGKPSGYNNVGKEVNEAAQKANIKVVWRDLPADMQRENYKRIATYPTSFLDKHFGNNNIVVDNNFLLLLHEKLIALENKFDQLLKKLDNNIITDNKEEDDDLPF
jgi:hypothetical protein